MKPLVFCLGKDSRNYRDAVLTQFMIFLSEHASLNCLRVPTHNEVGLA